VLNKPTFDYVIVGGGTAGCVLATRLSERAGVSVLLLEEGGANRNPLMRVPMACLKALDSRTMCTVYRSESEPGLGDACPEVPRGRGLGGSSSVNGMMFVRGDPRDFDEWAAMGCDGWAYEDVLPAFKKIECYTQGDPRVRGADGPINIRRFRSEPLCQLFVEAVQQAGYPYNEDYNGHSQEGVSWTQHNVFPGRAGRSSALTGYLEPVLERNNLAVETGSSVTRIVLDGYQAVGVAYQQRGQAREVCARAEVIVCAGAVRTPQLLMLSGIGNPLDLEPQDIPVQLALPGVGQNLQDHFGSFVQHRCLQPVTLTRHLGLAGMSRAIVEYLCHGEGLLSHWPTQAVAFLKTEENLERPDMQVLFAPILRQPGGSSTSRNRSDASGYCISWCQLRPMSSGRVWLRSADPKAAPRIRHNYLEHAADRQFHRRAIEVARQLHAQPAFESFRGEEISPGIGCSTAEAMDAHIRHTGHTHYHCAGTARMGHDELAVVDPKLRVHGLAQLRVADAAIMPRIVGANTHAASMMIGERAAALLLE